MGTNLIQAITFLRTEAKQHVWKNTAIICDWKSWPYQGQLFVILLFIIWFIAVIITTVPRSDTRNPGLHFVFPVASIEWANHLWPAMSLYSVINYSILLLINSQTEIICEECYHPDNIWLRFTIEFMAFIVTSKINRTMVKHNKTRGWQNLLSFFCKLFCPFKL